MKQHNSDLSGGYSDYVVLPKLNRNQHNPNFIPRFQWFRPQFTLRTGPTLSPYRYTGTMRTRCRQPNPPPSAGDAQTRRQCTPPLAHCARLLHTTTGLSSSIFELIFMVSWRVTSCVVLHPFLAPGGWFSDVLANVVPSPALTGCRQSSAVTLPSLVLPPARLQRFCFNFFSESQGPCFMYVCLFTVSAVATSTIRHPGLYFTPRTAKSMLQHNILLAWSALMKFLKLCMN